MGDIKPTALEFERLVKACQLLGEDGKGAELWYFREDTPHRIEDDASLAAAVGDLRAEDETADVLSVFFVPA